MITVHIKVARRDFRIKAVELVNLLRLSAPTRTVCRLLHLDRYGLGNAVVGKVVETGGDITFEVNYNDAPYDSAALNEVETIVFDLAVLTLSIQGEATHPRFLIHDGPRVSDLTENIYRRFFDYAKYLEDRADGNPNFQYIITTTTPPPEEFQKTPYLRLQLDSSTTEGRLLKCDLA